MYHNLNYHNFVIYFTGFNSSWTKSLHHNEGLFGIMEAFVDKESWSTIVHNQQCFTGGRGATGQTRQKIYPFTTVHGALILSQIGRVYFIEIFFAQEGLNVIRSSVSRI
jgi:hypothetical protein